VTRKWSGHIARTEEIRNVHRILVRLPEGMRPIVRPKRTREDNIKTNPENLCCEIVGWIPLA
jgi:hypothetical protein